MNTLRKLIALSFLVILTACSIQGSPTSAPTVDVAPTLDAARTEAAQTVTAGIVIPPTDTQAPPTETMTSVPTEEPSATPAPTETSITATDTVAVEPTEEIQPTATQAPVTSSDGLSLIISAVIKDVSVSVYAQNFPTNETFQIYLGPTTGFANNSVSAGSVYSGDTGTFRFNVDLPSAVQDLDQIALYLESNSGANKLTVFNNVTSGNVTYLNTATPSSPCQISASHSPSGKLTAGDEFDAIWTVTNTSGAKWDKKLVDYGYEKGEEMQKYNDLYDLPETVEAGDSITLTVDMVAPDDSGTYVTYWALKVDSSIICYLPMSIVVK